MRASPASHSTDFDVHRNWLAITANVHPSRFYTESTSQWTLDYPPFFAWFEWALARLLSCVPAARPMLSLAAEYKPSALEKLIHRSTVMLADLALALGVWAYVRRFDSVRHRVLLSAGVLLSPGLFLVDHVHFQYNGLLYGVLLGALAACRDGRFYLGAALFACLLNAKHLFVFMGPSFFVYLLSAHCLRARSLGQRLVRFASLGVVVLVVFAMSLGPFVYWGEMGALVQRLFPFKRGLSHAYWAANVWALYNVFDKLCARLAGVTGLAGESSSTSGLVGAGAHVCLPEITPGVALGLSVLAVVWPLVRQWRCKTFASFLRSLVETSLAAFLFGWHVHEKAILMAVIPFTLLAGEIVAQAQPQQAAQSAAAGLVSAFALLQLAGHYALLPLFFTPGEEALKVLAVLAYTLAVYACIALAGFRLSSVHALCGVALGAVHGYVLLVHPALFGAHMPFLPLLVTSVTCAIVVLGVYTWMQICGD